jgi:hypothetical protein
MAEKVYYRPHWSRLADDGTLTLPVSIYDDAGHASGVQEVPPTAADYSFWLWVVKQTRYAKSLDDVAVADARAEYDRFCKWRESVKCAMPDAEPRAAPGRRDA